MSETPGDAPLAEFWREEIPRLAVLYDRFAHALDPFHPGVDLAEQTFNSELASLFDSLPAPKPEFSRISSACDRALSRSSARQRQPFNGLAEV